MFNAEQMKKYKDFGLLGALIATVACCGCNFLNALFQNPDNYASVSVFSSISGIISYISLGCFLLVAACSFFIFLSERTMLELVTAGSWAAYAGLDLLYRIALIACKEIFASNVGVMSVASIVVSLSSLFVLIVHIVRARKTNTIILFMGVAAILGSFLSVLVSMFISNFIGDFKVVNIVNSVVYGFSSVLTPLFFFVESKAETD